MTDLFTTARGYRPRYTRPAPSTLEPGDTLTITSLLPKADWRHQTAATPSLGWIALTSLLGGE